MFVSWLLLSQSPAFGQQKYYWSDKRQISLSEDKTEMSFTFKQSRQRESLREQVARVADVAKVTFSLDGQFGSVSFKNAQSDDALKSAKKVGLDTADIEFASFGYKFENKYRLSTSHRIVLRPKKVRNILYSKARFISSQPGYGAGLVDAFKSLPLMNIALSGTTYLPSGSGTWTATPYEGAYPLTYTWQLRYPNDPWFDATSTGYTNSVTLTPPAFGSFRIRAKVTDANGRTGYSSEIFVDNGTGGYFNAPIDSLREEKFENRVASLPVTFALEQNYPNPFNPSTVISYQLPTSSNVSLKVFDVLGREIATLVNQRQEAGRYNYQFSIVNSQLSSGVYFYRLQAGSFAETKRMMLTK
jgi:hypothetical protein